MQVGEPVLRQSARPLSIEEIQSQPIQDLIDMMRTTMRDAPGVGLAAPQVGESIQLIVIEDQERYIARLTKEQISERERKPIDFHILINPQITEKEGSALFFEGCLSLPGFTALVPRAHSVRVSALNEKGESVEINASGWYARILQHEIDHLNGIVYIDKMQSRSLTNNENFERYWKDKPVSEIMDQD